MGSTGSYRFNEDCNGNYWCGKCTGPDYAYADKERKNSIGVEKNPYPHVNPD